MRSAPAVTVSAPPSGRLYLLLPGFRAEALSNGCLPAAVRSGQLTLDRGVGTTASLEMPALCPARGCFEQVEVWVFAGIDSHKDTLAVAVIDTGGRVVTVRQIANEPDGFTVLAGLVAEHAVVRVGIEGSSNFGWAAAMHPVAAGATVVECRR